MTGYLIYTLILLSIWTPMVALALDEYPRPYQGYSLLARLVFIFMLPIVLLVFLMEYLEGVEESGVKGLKGWWKAVVWGRASDD